MYYEVVAQMAKERGISIKSLENAANLGNGTIGKWKTQKPKLGNLEKVADVLGVSVVDIITKCNDTEGPEA